MTQFGLRATDAENAKRYEEAFGHYMAALDVFMHLIKCKSYLVFPNVFLIKHVYYS